MSQYTKNNKTDDAKITAAYVLLGLKRGKKYTQKQGVHAYRQKALLTHPDKNQNDPKAKEKFQKLVAAIELLITTKQFIFVKEEKKTEKPTTKSTVSSEEDVKPTAIVVRDPTVPFQKQSTKKGSAKWKVQNKSKAAKIRMENEANILLRQASVNDETSEFESDGDTVEEQVVMPKEKRIAKQVEKYQQRDMNLLHQRKVEDSKAAQEILLTNLKRQFEAAKHNPDQKALSHNHQQQIQELERRRRDWKEKKPSLPTFNGCLDKEGKDTEAAIAAAELDAAQEMEATPTHLVDDKWVIYGSDGVVYCGEDGHTYWEEYSEFGYNEDQVLADKVANFWETRAKKLTSYNTNPPKTYTPPYVKEAQDIQLVKEAHSKVKSYIKAYVEDGPDTDPELNHHKALAHMNLQKIAVASEGKDQDVSFDASVWWKDSSREQLELELGHPVADASWAAMRYLRGRQGEVLYTLSHGLVPVHGGKKQIGRPILAGLHRGVARVEAKAKSKRKHGGFCGWLSWWERDQLDDDPFAQPWSGIVPLPECRH
jgi:curved DNA-binding protein CbpA